MLHDFPLAVAAYLMAHTHLFLRLLFAGAGPFVEARLPRRREAAGLRRVATNTALYVGWALVVSCYSVAVLLLIRKFPAVRFGLIGGADWPVAVKHALSFVVLDFTNYAAHRFEHAVPIFWRFHRVHHSDRLLDLSTAVRKHPLSGLVTTSFAVVAVLAAGIPPESLFLYNVVADVVGFLAHSSLRLPRSLEARMKRARVITPDDHELHHSDWRPETDSNFGQVTSLWDRLFGTYRENVGRPGFRLGLRDGDSAGVEVEVEVGRGRSGSHAGAV